ncbi:ABC transporter [Pseudoalteromonas luteoviolacea]|uniref:ABC transporter n=1 Tax=Pseudoalteromonas luteoviolacea TaxID=43657 RepID=A0A1C0TP96_9GAMM|nr:ABC transporter ATP-binding protein [Pseudoalteromonas luteoviolacea]MBQ4813592.1 ABC transporter ATP-binding protein [Pseudoalteromonas luteoviolacea]OCQ20548.1 ABC transporter [Pseudoalteromonas luteoviolacea]
MVAAQVSINNLDLVINNKHILSDISFNVAPGQFIGLIGPNGAGKSSLLRCLYRFQTPVSGTVLIDQTDINQFDRQTYARKVAAVLQEIPSQFNLAVFDVVAMGLTPHKRLFSSISLRDRQTIQEALHKVGLTHKQKQSYESLSGGEKQRVMIARAVVQRPSLLLMDEPTSHLDVKYQIEIMALAKSLGITVIASFHDLNLASALCDAILVLDKGRLVATGAPKNVMTTEMLANVFGVKAEVTLHSPSQMPHIRYQYQLDESELILQKSGRQG